MLITSQDRTTTAYVADSHAERVARAVYSNSSNLPTAVNA